MYVRGLVEAIHQEANSRHRWRLLQDEMLSGVFYIRYQRHFVFFRELSPGSIGVISVLHDNMNIPLRLREDSIPQEDE
jgi:plasmid stabilization system protein ParE